MDPRSLLALAVAPRALARGSRPLCAALGVFLLALGLTGCTFSRVQSNPTYRQLDPAGIVIGESTWRDVLQELGTPSGASAEKVNGGVPSMLTFRYNCLDEKQFSILFSYLLKLPFVWNDRQTGYVLIVEFTPEGTVSDLYTIQQEAVWRPFQSERNREVDLLGQRKEGAP